jgi:DNA-binding SARP family transcriptional activator
VVRAARRAWSQRILDVVAATCAALLAFGAVPAVLVLVVGNPLTGGLGHTWRPLPRDALCLLVVAAWVAWAACCVQLARAVVADVRNGATGIHRGSSVLDRLAARIAFGILALTSFGTTLTLAGGAGASVPATNEPTSSITAPLRVHATGASPTTLDSRVYAVRPGDTLWRIADDVLGDGGDWTSLAALNLGRDVGHGGRFVDPDQLRAGWQLRLPADAGRSDEEMRPGGSAGAARQGQHEHLPELIALGLGSMACAALARRAGRQRRLGSRFSDNQITPQSEPALDAATLLQRFEGVPALHAFEAANCLLGLALEGSASVPRTRAICVSPTGVTFHLVGAEQVEAPVGFTGVDGGSAWHVSHDALHQHSPSHPYLPVVFPVGDDDAGTWLVPLEAGHVLPLLGEAAPDLWRAARAAVESWDWSETILVTEDPGDPELHAETSGDPATARHVLFRGDPASLPPAVAGRCAVITMQPVAASDLAILVDRRAATLHPMGLVVRPHLQSAETAAGLAELVAPPRADDRARPSRTASPRPGTMRSDTMRPVDDAGALAPGAIDVRLLTMTPRLDGLHDDLPANRARRAVELVAYLALHQPDVVTSDRLRTRVLGSSDADAAAKTLFNTAYAARRAMGVDADGNPLFPAGSRHGLYQLSPGVTVDVQRAVELCGVATSATDPAMAIAYCRAALSLVEGEPLANALAGYAWWEAEGHGGRIAAVLVDAACLMASLASDSGHFDLARWGLEQARFVEPYSEALSRAAMQVAATEGDADRLRLEWRDCQRRIDALDPGSSPSARTETLYGELSRRVLVGAAPIQGAAAVSTSEASD